MTPELAGIMDRLRRHFDVVYGPRLAQLVLYGSHARGDASPGSDIDVLVVLRGRLDRGKEVRRNSQFLAELCLEEGSVVSCFYMDEARFQRGHGPLLRNIRREGVAA